MPSDVTLVLASASPARLKTLRGAGIEPVVQVSGVDEDAVTETDPAGLAALLARLKAESVAGRLGAGRREARSRVLVLGCDSVLDVDGVGYGKPETPEVATRRLRALRGRSAVLHTGHHLVDLGEGTADDGAWAVRESLSAVASTTVEFGSFSDAEIAAYVATGEPLAVAGAFTVDGLGGAFVERVVGDFHNVVGLSLPLLRRMVGEVGVDWFRLWASETGRRISG